MGAACNKAAVLLTFQRSLCVEDGILMLTWYEAIRILQQPAVRALLAALEPLNVTPLVEHRVVRVLLSDPAAIGMQIVTGKCREQSRACPRPNIPEVSLTTH